MKKTLLLDAKKSGETYNGATVIYSAQVHDSYLFATFWSDIDLSVAILFRMSRRIYMLLASHTTHNFFWTFEISFRMY